MNKFALAGVAAALVVVVYLVLDAMNDMGVHADGRTVTLETKDLDVTFSVEGEVDGIYMIFGGVSLSHPNAIGKVTIAGLDLEDARRIYASYPDFHRCSSPGAREAMPLVYQMNLVPADASVFNALKDALQRHEQSLKDGGARVCVRVTGSSLELESVKVREHGADWTSRFEDFEFYLITSAEVVDGETALAGN